MKLSINIISRREKLKSLKHLIKLIARPKMSHGHRIRDTHITHWKDRCTFISCLRKCDTRNRQTQTHLIAVHIHSRSFSRVQHACCEEERNAVLIRSRFFDQIVIIKYNIGNSILTDCHTFWIANHEACRGPMRFCMTCTYTRHASRISFCSILFT